MKYFPAAALAYSLMILLPSNYCSNTKDIEIRENLTPERNESTLLIPGRMNMFVNYERTAFA